MTKETYIVTNGKNTMTLHDSNQLSAFLNNGWTEQKAEAKPVEEKKVGRPARKKEADE